MQAECAASAAMTWANTEGDIHANTHIPQHDHDNHLNQIERLFSDVEARLATNQLGRAHETLTELDTYINDNLLPACVALRAYTCQRQQAYDDGAALADQYIGQKRHNPDGYLLAGNMLLLSDKTEKALQTYRKGVHLSSHDHPRYPELIRQRDHVEYLVALKNTRGALALPTEVIHFTLLFLKRRELANLSSTCKAWHNLIMSWPGMWRKLVIDNRGDRLPHDHFQPFFARAPPKHVRALSIRSSDDEWSASAYYDITLYNWNHIEELDIYCGGEGTLSPNYMERADTAVSVIRNCKDTLRILRLRVDRGRHVLNYSLENCRNLEYLIYDDDYDDEDFSMMDVEFDPEIPDGPFGLRRIDILCQSNTLDIPTLVSRCAQLERLDLFHFEEDELDRNRAGILQALCYNCPQLHTVRIQERNVSVLELEPLLPRQQHSHNHVRGLRELTFNSDPTPVREELTDLIHNNQHSLEIFDVKENFHPVIIYQMFAGMRMSNLRVLRCAVLTDDDDDDNENGGNTNPFNLLKAMIDVSPRLQEVDIPGGAASDVVLGALGRLQNLTELKFSVCEYVTCDGLASLFSRTQSLQRVHVSLAGTSTSNRLPDLIKQVAGCKPLQQLEVSSDTWERMSDILLQDLASDIKSKEPNLQKVVMKNTRQYLSGKAILLWSNFKQLRYLRIINLRLDVPWSKCIDVVKQISIPNLEIEFEKMEGTRFFHLDSNGNYDQNAMDDGDAA